MNQSAYFSSSRLAIPLVLVALVSAFLSGCQGQSASEPADSAEVASPAEPLIEPNQSAEEPETALVSDLPDDKVTPVEQQESPRVASVESPLNESQQEVPAGKVRNVILLLGDGMGPQQMGLLSFYAHLAPGSKVPDGLPAIDKLSQEGQVALVRTNPHGALVADSASAATQLASGEPSGSEMIGANYRGESVTTVLEIAKQLGKSTGLISDTRLTHATPAAFAAHQPHRTMENEIAVDMLENQVDVMLGGGLRNWVPEAINDQSSAAYLSLVQLTGGQFEMTSRRQDNRNLLLEARRDYQLVFDRVGLEQVESGRVLGLFADSEMYDALSERALLGREDRKQPTLAEMTTAALRVLSKNPEGFFLMVEGGQIDWAGHNNDTGTMLHEMLQFDEAVRIVYQWAKERDDTLVLVTADHETGSFGFSYTGIPQPVPRELSGDVFENHSFQPYFNFAEAEVLDRIYSQEKSFFQIFQEFDAQPVEQRTADRLRELINASLPFSITLDEAVSILTRSRNRQYVAGHKYLGSPTVPLVSDLEAFYVYGENSRMNVLGHIIAAQQNVVWGTGTHTSTPVVLASFGPPEATGRFTGMLHATDVGKRMIEVVRGGQPAASLGTAQNPTREDRAQ